MSKIKTLISLKKKNKDLIYPLGYNGFLNWMSDSMYLKLLFKSLMGYKLDLKNPVTFNEKLQWLKLHDRKNEYIGLVDKIEAKHIVGGIIGSDHIVPIIKIWKNAKQIDFDSLPNQFVLKCNHDQGSVIIVRNKEDIDKKKIVKFLTKCLKKNPYPGTREYPYKKIKPMVFAEKLLDANIVDYKFYCFHGEPLFLYCSKGLTEDHSLKIDFFDMEWNLMPFYRTDYNRLGKIPKPKKLGEMIKIAKELSKSIPFVRIDLFEVNDVVYFSEFTLYPASGFMPFVPNEYDKIIGDYLVLPMNKKEANKNG